MRKRLWLLLAVLFLLVVSGLAVFFLLYHPAQAMEFFYWNTTIVDFNAGRFYHTALSWRGDGEVQLLPVGFEHPWVPGNNTGLPPRGAPAVAYWNRHIYVIGGDIKFGETYNNVYYTTIVSTLTHELADWQETTPLPNGLYPEGLYRHEAAVRTFTETNKTYLYVFGGKEDAGGSSTCYDKVIYAEIHPDGTLGDWQETTPLPTPLFGMESLVLNGRIYILGGADQSGQSRREVYYAVPDPDTGQISEWHQTALLPALGAGGYVELSAAVEHGRIYVYGGSNGAVSPTYSPYVHFATPDPATGAISGWTMANETLPYNCYASEGAAYESGLLLAVAGAWNNAIDPSGDVRAALLDHETGQTSEWGSTLALTPRFWHGVVQDDFGWLYSLCGATGSAHGAPRLNEVWIASPYGEGRGFQAAGGIIYPTQETTPTIYAPSGVYTSSVILVQLVEGQEATLTGLSWNTTITDPALMTITMRYRYHHAGQWTSWYGPFPSQPGIGVTTTLPISGTCDWFQYSAHLATLSDTVTPFLNAVRIGILAPPNLAVKNLTVTGCDTCPTLIPPNEPVDIVFTVRNEGSGLRWGNNFYAMLFITTTPDYTPYPPALPIGCENYPTVTCPLIVPMQGMYFGEGTPPQTVTVPWTFTEPGVYYLVAYADYNDTPAMPPPIYDVGEYNEFDNLQRLTVHVGTLSIHLPLVTKGWP
ncbi:MAG: hypothetical protein ACP5OO_07070 [Chloroflexia bacterium]